MNQGRFPAFLKDAKRVACVKSDRHTGHRDSEVVARDVEAFHDRAINTDWNTRRRLFDEIDGVFDFMNKVGDFSHADSATRAFEIMGDTKKM